MPKKFPDNANCYRYREIEYRMLATVETPAEITLAAWGPTGGRNKRIAVLFAKITI